MYYEGTTYLSFIFYISEPQRELLSFKAVQLCVLIVFYLELCPISLSFYEGLALKWYLLCQKSDTDRIAKNLLKQNPS